MIPYFPRPLPDELLYSVLARYHRHVASLGPSQTALDLFGRRHSVASVDLPGHMSALADALDPRLGLTAEILLERTTLLPYYLSFQPAAVRLAATQDLLVGASDVHIRLGVVASKVRPGKRLRFCLECRRESLQCHGEDYWRRSHNLPGVFVCHIHGSVLRLADFELGALNRHRFVAADGRACPPEAPPSCRANGSALPQLRRLAAASSALLTSGAPPPDQAQPGDRYRTALRGCGLMRSRGRVDQPALQEKFLESWGACSPVLEGIFDGCGRAGPWLAAIVRTHRKAFHPMQHLLFQGMVDGLDPAAPPGNDGEAVPARTWPCRNPLAAHRGQDVAALSSWTGHKGNRIATITCGCGYVYRVSRLARGTWGSPRYLSFGPMLELALRGMIAAGDGLRTIARTLEIDCKTVRREAAMADLGSPWKPWHAPFGRRQGRRRERAPTIRGRRKPSSPRRNWAAIDADLLARLAGARSQLLLEEPPVRVTRLGLERRLAGGGWIGKRRSKLPRATAALDAAAEDGPEFALRRTAFKGRLMMKDGLPEAWKLMRAAGLKADDLPIAEKVRAGLEAACAKPVGTAAVVVPSPTRPRIAQPYIRHALKS